MFLPLAVTAVSAQTAVSNVAIYEAVTSTGKNAKGIQEFYASTNYQPLWVGPKNKARRKALMAALRSSGDHGLPTSRYDIDNLNAAFKVDGKKATSATTELLATKRYLQYAHDLSSGALNPKKIDKEMAIDRPWRSDENLLTAFSKSSPTGFLDALAPKSLEYKNLLAEKKRLETCRQCLWHKSENSIANFEKRFVR